MIFKAGDKVKLAGLGLACSFGEKYGDKVFTVHSITTRNASIIGKYQVWIDVYAHGQTGYLGTTWWMETECFELVNSRCMMEERNDI